MNKLKEFRVSAGLTQEALAFECGWRGQSRISAYETGRDPRFKDMRKIVSVLMGQGVECTVDDVFPPPTINGN